VGGYDWNTLKYEGEEDYENTLVNVSPEEVSAGKMAFLTFGAVNKNRI
jgi:hypothetical protein